MSLLRFTILIVFGVVTSQSHNVNSKIPYGGSPRRRSMEATTIIPPDPRVEDLGVQLLLTRLESLCIEKLEFLITDTNTRFQSLENQLSQCSSCSASGVVQKIENLEAKVETLSKNIQDLMDATKNLPSDVETIKLNVSSIINVTRSLVDLSSNSEFKQILNKGLQEPKDLQTATSISCPINVTLDKQYPKNCREVREYEKTSSGFYMIQPEGAPKPFEAVCELVTRGGGWTVMQRRFDGSQDFYLDWENYKNGFGNLGGEFWLGLENIHLLTRFGVNELLIELGDFDSYNVSAFYSEFSIGSEMEGYSLKVLGAYSGDSGDSLTYNAGMKFTTKDRDQDEHSGLQCADYHNGAWWYLACTHSNLNGKYFHRGQVPPDNAPTIHWNTFHHRISLKNTRMLVRPKV